MTGPVSVAYSWHVICINKLQQYVGFCSLDRYILIFVSCPVGGGRYESRTESHEQLFFACELGTADEEECGGRWNQLLCYP